MSSVRMHLLSAPIAALLALTCATGPADASPTARHQPAPTVRTAPVARVSGPAARTRRASAFFDRWIHAINVRDWRWVHDHTTRKNLRELRRIRRYSGTFWPWDKTPCELLVPHHPYRYPRKRDCYMNFGGARVVLQHNGAFAVTDWFIYE